MKTKLRLLFPILALCVLSCDSTEEKTTTSKTEIWRFTLQLGEDDLPFTAKLLADDTLISGFTVINAEEEIELMPAEEKISHRAVFDFPVYPSRIVLQRESPDLITGYWEDFDRDDYRIPLVGERGKDFRFTPTKSTTAVAPRYKVRFGTEEKGYDGLLELQNDKGKLSGTFLTQSGDYRYLSGNIMNGKVNLSTFDGNHAYLFDALISGDSLASGRYLSGNHFSNRWHGLADTVFTLRHPTEVTVPTEETRAFRFSLPDRDGKLVDSENLYAQNNVYIFQITGSWCPNCKDASQAMHALITEYDRPDLVFLPINFERYEDLDKARGRIDKMHRDLNLPKEFLFGGKADKATTSEALPGIDGVRAYPTIIITNRQGKMGRIFSGFYGPATGLRHERLMEDIYQSVDSLLKTS